MGLECISFMMGREVVSERWVVVGEWLSEKNEISVAVGDAKNIRK